MEMDMDYWQQERLAQLDRNQIENVASRAIAELISIHEDKLKRDLQEKFMLTFAAGIVFALVACIVGVNLH
jgi:hypothetical protein